jgi:hypothetical protein
MVVVSPFPRRSVLRHNRLGHQPLEADRLGEALERHALLSWPARDERLHGRIVDDGNGSYALEGSLSSTPNVIGPGRDVLITDHGTDRMPAAAGARHRVALRRAGHTTFVIEPSATLAHLACEKSVMGQPLKLNCTRIAILA